MQNYCKTIGALAAASALVAGNASAEVEYEIHAGYTSEYIFRGINLGQDLAEVGVDVATQAAGLDLSAGFWYGSVQRAPGFFFDEAYDEVDIYAEVSKDLGFATAAVGYIYYHFPSNFVNFDDAQEVYFSLSREIFGLDASLAYFWDIESDNDGYAELGLSKAIELNQCLTLNVGGALGYLAEEGDLAHLTTKVSLDWAFTETATLSPFIAHSWALTENPGHVGTSAYVGSKNQLFGGAMLSVSF